MWIIQPNQQPEKEEKWDYNHSEKLLENLIQLQEKLFQGNYFVSDITLVDHINLECVLRMVVDTILPHAESGPNDHRKYAPPFTSYVALSR